MQNSSREAGCTAGAVPTTKVPWQFCKRQLKDSSHISAQTVTIVACSGLVGTEPGKIWSGSGLLLFCLYEVAQECLERSPELCLHTLFSMVHTWASLEWCNYEQNELINNPENITLKFSNIYTTYDNGMWLGTTKYSHLIEWQTPGILRATPTTFILLEIRHSTRRTAQIL